MRRRAVSEHKQPHRTALAAQPLRQLSTHSAALRGTGHRRHRRHRNRNVRGADLVPQPSCDEQRQRKLDALGGQDLRIERDLNIRAVPGEAAHCTHHGSRIDRRNSYPAWTTLCQRTRRH
jgi:hypothetical protein